MLHIYNKEWLTRPFITIYFKGLTFSWYNGWSRNYQILFTTKIFRYTVAQAQKLDKLLKKYKDVFTDEVSTMNFHEAKLRVLDHNITEPIQFHLQLERRWERNWIACSQKALLSG